MKTGNNKSIAALTLIEVLVVMAILFFVAEMLLPMLANRHRRSPRITCVNQLKQVSLGWRLWANDNRDLLPWQVPLKDGGAMRNVGSGPLDIVQQFLVASNEIGTPKVIVCPSDVAKKPVANWEKFRIQSTDTHPHISYFYNQDAANDSPQMFLAGDRNMVAATNAPIPLGRMGVASLTLNSSNYSTVDWDPKTLHQGGGNIALEDGSVLQVRSTQVRAQAALVLKGTTNQMRLNYPGY